jgi:uncharacterized protein YjbI with pentapeptide repeats
MCSHSYVARHDFSPRSVGRACPCPGLYAGRSPLPIDPHGLCIFHSRELAWKRDEGFDAHFRRLMTFLDEDESLQTYDFAEFVFVGESQAGGSRFHVCGVTFRQAACFTGASFIDAVTFTDVVFARGAAFDQANFSQDVTFENGTIRGSDFSHATVAARLFFKKVHFRDYALFSGARFSGSTTGTVVRFEDTEFEGISDFSNASFSLGTESGVGFWRVQFLDFVNFHGTRFDCHVEFDEVSFGYQTEFTDTVFDSVGSSARYRGSAVEFNRIEVPAEALLTFQSTDARNRLFKYDVQMSFKEEPAGTIRFENVNFSKISPDTRARLLQLSKMGRVEIGSGCIKYRYQTPIRTISMSEGNQALIVEICQTFTNYFTKSNGLNLGFEVVERHPSRISFFYFTDEDITEATFIQRLAETERRLWSLLSARSGRQLRAVESSAALTASENVVINAIDGLSALMGTFFRVGARIFLGAWTAADTRALLTAIGFNEAGADDRATSLHRVLIAKYTGNRLLDINRRQHDRLLPMGADAEDSRPEKLRILFLGANSHENPLNLEQDVSQIQRALRSSRNRDRLEFLQEWAVTIEDLTRALLEASPAIVHFAGHGSQEGIFLNDATGKDQLVPADALARLFELFTDTVQCVVLSSCYSEYQGRAIQSHIPFVIGMRGEIPDATAIAFTRGFYQAIGAGREIPAAFAFGVSRIPLERRFGEHIPVLLPAAVA